MRFGAWTAGGILVLLAASTEAVPRVVAVEDFTNIDCSGCNDIKDSVDKIFGEFAGRIAPIRYHVDWPNPVDPFHLYNPTDVNTRKSYYTVSYAPSFRFDGKKLKDPYQFPAYVFFYEWMRGTLDSLSAIPSKLRIRIEQEANLESVYVDYDIVAVDTAGNFLIQVAVVEDSSTADSIGFKRIMRDMIPTGGGSAVSLALGDSVHYKRGYPLPLGETDLHTMIWLQQPGTKRILQSAYSRVQVLSGVESAPPPLRIVLDPNTPNPFNPETTIRFRLGDGGEARLAIYDPVGRLVTELFSGRAEAGEHSAVWDGRDRAGREAGSGVYFYRLDAESASWTRSMVLIR